MFEESDNAGIGIIVWNSYGDRSDGAALSQKIPKPPSVEILEIFDAMRAVKFVQEIGLQLQDSHFECYSLVGIKTLQRGNMHMLLSSFWSLNF